MSAELLTIYGSRECITFLRTCNSKIKVIEVNQNISCMVSFPQKHSTTTHTLIRLFSNSLRSNENNLIYFLQQLGEHRKAKVFC